MNLVFRALMVLFIICYFSGCKEKEGRQLVKEMGFLVLIEPDQWMFYPAIQLNQDSCETNFASKNLGIGISVPFNAFPDSTYSKIRRSLDTLNLVQHIESVNGMYNYVLIGAVEIQYEIDRKFHQTASQLRSNLLFSTREGKVNLVYDQFPIDVVNISPLLCLQKRIETIIATECYHSPDDPDGYLYKICEYLRSANKYTDLSGKYKIRSTSIDTLKGRSMIKVTLSCCGLGDVAYFDIKTKELVHLRYGAR